MKKQNETHGKMQKLMGLLLLLCLFVSLSTNSLWDNKGVEFVSGPQTEADEQISDEPVIEEEAEVIPEPVEELEPVPEPAPTITPQITPQPEVEPEPTATPETAETPAPEVPGQPELTPEPQPAVSPLPTTVPEPSATPQPSALPVPQITATPEPVIPEQTEDKTSDEYRKGLCPHHPEHDDTCGYQAGKQECQYHCEICDPTAVSIASGLGKQVEPGEKLKLKQLVSFDPVKDTQGNKITIEIWIENDKGEVQTPDRNSWTPVKEGKYTVYYVAVKTVDGQRVECGKLEHPVTVREKLTEISEVSLTVNEPEFSDPVTPVTLNDPEQGWSATGTWRFDNEMMFETFPETTAVLEMNLTPEKKFCFTQDTVVRLNDEVQSVIFNSDGTLTFSKEYTVEKEPVTVVSEQTVEPDENLKVTARGLIPEGYTLNAELRRNDNPETLFSLDLYFTDNELRRVDEPLENPVELIIESDSIVSDRYSVFSLGHPQRMILSETPLEAAVQSGSVRFSLTDPGVYDLRAEYVIEVDLPEHGFVNQAVDLVSNLRVNPSEYKGKPLTVSLVSVGIMGNRDFVWDHQTELVPERPGVYKLLYEASTEEKEVISRKEIQFVVEGDRPVGEFLDGDYAYISDAGLLEDERTESKLAIRTGTAPWDADDNPGNDTTEFNNSLRSYDIASYTVFFKSKVRTSAPCSAYKEGRLFFEFIVPGEHTEVQFETDSMGWLSAKKDIHYQLSEAQHNGSTVQVLRGSYIWEPSANNPTAIGESYQELSVVVRALNMIQGDKIKPEFSFWLEHNQVPSEVDENHIPTGALVSDSHYVCTEHQEVEYKGIEAPEITVTSRLNLNVRLVPGNYTHNQTLGEYDFNTGNEDSFHKGKGVKNGRIIGYGAVLQVVSKGSGHGLRGVQFPDGQPITFDINISNRFVGDTGVEYSTEGYEPLVWCAEDNNGSRTAGNGRTLQGMPNPLILNVPGNQRDQLSEYYMSKSCTQGGDWVTDLSPDGKTLHVTVSGYSWNFDDPIAFPYANPESSKVSYVYYNPDNTSHYWEISTACFSAGRIYVVQPFYNAEGEYIVDKFHDTGTFHVDLTDARLMASSVDSQGNRTQLTPSEDNTNQPVQNDDRANYTCWISNPGNISPSVYYNRYDKPIWYTSLTEGCLQNGKDWLMRGSGLSIEFRVSHINAEGLNGNVAIDHLIKFDDRFFEPERVTTSYGGKALFGAKPDGKGWDHKGLKPDQPGYDDEMRYATAEDLVFYSSLEALKAEGKTPVAVLSEVRYVSETQQYQPSGYIYGYSKNDPSLDGNVFMVINSVRSWKRSDVMESAKAYLGKDTLTVEDYRRYVKEAFPSRADVTDAPMKYEDYPDEAFWIYEPEKIPGLRNYKKSVYDETGYVTGTSGTIYGDSCLVVGYKSTVEKKVSQVIDNTDTEKKAYDLDVNQRVADYEILGKIHRTKVLSTTDTEMKDVVHIKDILPAGLSYIPGSSYLGGTYIQTAGGKQGKIEGGRQLPNPVMTDNPDGSVTMEWVIPDFTITNEEITYVPPLYYSCDIGTPGNEETDVENNQSLLNTVMIWCEGEQKRGFNAVNENIADYSILVSKNRSVSISKQADQAVVEKQEPMGFVMNVGNNGQNVMNVIAVDSLPYNGDAGNSSFTGPCEVSELSLLIEDEQQLKKVLNDNFHFYYTTEESLRGKGSLDFVPEDFKTEQWTELEISEQGVITIPQEHFAPVAVAAVGQLPGGTTLKSHITLELPDAIPGDYIANRLTRGDMESYARSYVVSRTLEGLVWVDEDVNGMQGHTEKVFDGDVSVHLLKLKDKGDPENRQDYEPFVMNGREISIQLGQQINLTENNVRSFKPGEYRFVNLPAGVFAVEFRHSQDLDPYRVTAMDQGTDDSIDSDATGVYDKEGLLETGYILNILMPQKENIRSMMYSSLHHDMGIYGLKEFSFTKVKAEDTTKPLKGAEFRLYLRQEGCTEDLIDPADPGHWKLVDTRTSNAEGVIRFEQLIPGEYRLVETKAPDGRLLPQGQWSFTVEAGQEIRVPQAVGEIMPPAFALIDGKMILVNMKPADVPHTGGSGITGFGMFSAVLAGLGAFLLLKGNGKKHQA